MRSFWRKPARNKINVFTDPVRVVQREELIFRFLLDAQLTEADELSDLLGIPPITEEETAEEEAESIARVNRLTPITPLLYYLSEVISTTVANHLNAEMDAASLNEDTLNMLADLLGRVSFASTVASITQLEDLGLISYEYEEQ